jgi:hypothetical protein
LRKQYLIKELWILAWNASVQHASLYKPGAWQNDRDRISKFRGTIISYVSESLIPKYKQVVTETEHCKNITDLISFANSSDEGVLGTEGYKYGIAQKLLNLSLKYYWCLGEIIEPPHCPVDKIVIDKTSLRGRINWTQITKEAEYLKVICEIAKLAKYTNQSIAVWELSEYERR